MDKCPNCGAGENKYGRKCWFCGKDLPQARIPSLFRGEPRRKKILGTSPLSLLRGEQEGEVHEPAPELRVCPVCREKSLWDNFQSNKWECLNRKCESHKAKGEEIFGSIEEYLRNKFEGKELADRPKKSDADEKFREKTRKEEDPEKLLDKGEKELQELQQVAEETQPTVTLPKESASIKDVDDLDRQLRDLDERRIRQQQQLDAWREGLAKADQEHIKEVEMRGDETLRDIMYHGHPPYCTCTECTRRRLAEKRVSDRTAIHREGGSKSFARSRTKVMGTKGAKKFFLFLLLLVCVAVVPYTGYLLYEHKVNPLTGGAILLINIGALIWNMSLLRKYRAGFGSLFAIFVVVALICSTVCAFAGIEPFAEVKQRVIEFVGDIDLFEQPELDVKIVRFERGKSADEIFFLLSVSGTEKTVDGVVYTIEILGDELILGSTDVSTVGGLSDFTPAGVVVRGPTIVRMLQDLDEKYEDARARRIEFGDRTGWEMIFEGKLFDYDWMKRTREKLAELADEENKWRVLRSGRSFSNSDLDRFCRRYVRIVIRQGEG